MPALTDTSPGAIRSLIPARVDRLPWSPFHTRMVIALGVAWVLDGLEITVASSVAGALSKADTLNMSSTAVGAIATVYLVGEVVGALVFGRLSDRLGRRNLFMVTLGVYLIGSGLTALTLGASAGWVGDGYDGVHIFSPEGQRIGMILLPEICANVCFGGEKRNRLFMAASQSLYAVYVEAEGAHIC